VRPPVAGLPFFKTVVGVLLFGSFSYLQNDSHRYLTSLKKYSLPERGLFKQIISPHYTAECMIYLSMALVAAPKAQVLNKTIVTALFFEIVNLGITAESTRKWYAKKFGERSIKGRWRMIPFVY
jgi:3-oxo-5-alpha-steroid 4-dehydrogenase 3